MYNITSQANSVTITPQNPVQLPSKPTSRSNVTITLDIAKLSDLSIYYVKELHQNNYVKNGYF